MKKRTKREQVTKLRRREEETKRDDEERERVRKRLNRHMEKITLLDMDTPTLISYEAASPSKISNMVRACENFAKISKWKKN